jgi:hypothetical protein
MSTGAIVGSVGGGIVGVAILIFIITFIIRRVRRNKDEFDAVDFRRSAVMMDEDTDSGAGAGMAGAGYNASRNPRPPTMIERKMNNTAGVGATNYGGGYAAGYGATGNTSPYTAQGGYSDYPSSPAPGAAYQYQDNNAYGYSAQHPAQQGGAYGQQYDHQAYGNTGYNEYDYGRHETHTPAPAAAPAQRVPMHNTEANAANRMSTATVADDAYGGI